MKVLGSGWETLTTSLAVAEAYGKRQSDVLRAIDAIVAETDYAILRRENFVFRETAYDARNGRCPQELGASSALLRLEK